MAAVVRVVVQVGLRCGSRQRAAKMLVVATQREIKSYHIPEVRRPRLRPFLTTHMPLKPLTTHMLRAAFGRP